MSRPSTRLTIGAVFSLICACDQLGNPEQLTTGPTLWKAGQYELVTTTRSFRNPSTIRRLVADGLEDLDFADPSIGPEQTLTFVMVAPRRLRPMRTGSMKLVTVFEIDGQGPVARQWSVAQGSRQWAAAFALQAPPSGAITSAAP